MYTYIHIILRIYNINVFIITNIIEKCIYIYIYIFLNCLLCKIFVNPSHPYYTYYISNSTNRYPKSILKIRGNAENIKQKKKKSVSFAKPEGQDRSGGLDLRKSSATAKHATKQASRPSLYRRFMSHKSPFTMAKKL